jgi:hypothetical protein
MMDPANLQVAVTAEKANIRTMTEVDPDILYIPVSVQTDSSSAYTVDHWRKFFKIIGL